MPFIKKDTYYLEYISEGKTLTGLTKAKAFEIAEKFVGNSSYNRIFPNEERFLFGPGDGTTSIHIAQEKDWVPRSPI